VFEPFLIAQIVPARIAIDSAAIVICSLFFAQRQLRPGKHSLTGLVIEHEKAGLAATASDIQ